MASGDKPVDAVTLATDEADQGTHLFSPDPGGRAFQGNVALSGATPGGAAVVIKANVQFFASTEAGVPDFDVEKQYKLTIEEV